MDTYTTWENVPENLKTKTQLEKQGMRLAPGQKSVAIKTGGYGPYKLYDINSAIPKRELTEAQRIAAAANLEKARAALHCVDCGRYSLRLDDNGRCRGCRDHYRMKQESRRASEMLSKLAGADNWLIVDTETTGLDGAAEVVQIAVVGADGCVLADTLVKPLGDIPQEATAIHGLDAAAVSNAPTWVDVYPQLSDLLNGRLVLAYNASFDARMISQTCALYNLPTPTADWECVMELFAAHAGMWSGYHDSFLWHKLAEACRMRGITPQNTHAATGDALLTWQLVKSFGM